MSFRNGGNGNRFSEKLKREYEENVPKRPKFSSVASLARANAKKTATISTNPLNRPKGYNRPPLNQQLQPKPTQLPLPANVTPVPGFHKTVDTTAAASTSEKPPKLAKLSTTATQWQPYTVYKQMKRGDRDIFEDANDDEERENAMDTASDVPVDLSKPPDDEHNWVRRGTRWLTEEAAQQEDFLRPFRSQTLGSREKFYIPYDVAIAKDDADSRAKKAKAKEEREENKRKGIKTPRVVKNKPSMDGIGDIDEVMASLTIAEGNSKKARGEHNLLFKPLNPGKAGKKRKSYDAETVYDSDFQWTRSMVRQARREFPDATFRSEEPYPYFFPNRSARPGLKDGNDPVPLLMYVWDLTYRVVTNNPMVPPDQRLTIVINGLDYFGNTSTLLVHGFKPFIKVGIPDNWIAMAKRQAPGDVDGFLRHRLSLLRKRLNYGMKEYIDKHMAGYKRRNLQLEELMPVGSTWATGDVIHDLQLVERKTRSLMGYKPEDMLGRHAKLELIHPQLVPIALKLLRMGMEGDNHLWLNKQWEPDEQVVILRAQPPNGHNILERGLPQEHFDVYEADVPFTTRVCISNDIAANSWIKVPDGRFYEVQEQRRISISDLEVECNLRDVRQIGHESSKDYDVQLKEMPYWGPLKEQRGDMDQDRKVSTLFPPLTTMCLDIEVLNPPQGFPSPFDDPIIKIGAKVMRSDTRGYTSYMFALLESKEPETDDPEMKAANENFKKKTKSFYFNTERELLIAFFKFWQIQQANFASGWNGNFFDFPFIFNRAIALNIPHVLTLGYMCGERIKAVATVRSTNAGTFRVATIRVQGTAMYDMMEYVAKLKSLSYKGLSFAARTLLNMDKVELSYTLIPSYFCTPVGRFFEDVYCDQDVQLMIEFLLNLKFDISLVEIAGTSHVTTQEFLDKGMMYRIYALVLYVNRLVQDKIYKPGTVELLVPNKVNLEGDVPYTGADVFLPRFGLYYDVPIATLDFQSLYPSIMMRENLCPSTYVPPMKIREYNLIQNRDFKRCPEVKHDPESRRITVTESTRNHGFMKKEKCPAVLGIAERRLFDERQDMKKLMGHYGSLIEKMEKEIKEFNQGEATEEQKKLLAAWSVDRDRYNSAQEARKLTGNSIYGVVAHRLCQLFCLPVSETVTQYGRYLISYTAHCVERDYAGAPISREDMRKYIKEMQKIHGSEIELTEEMLDKVYNPEYIEIANTIKCWVVYGDTDSVMVAMKPIDPNVPLYDTQDKMKTLGIKFLKHLANHMNAILDLMGDPRPYWEGGDGKILVLTPEKILLHYLQIKKKRYGGLMIECNLKESLLTKGLGSRRRDCAKWIKNLIVDTLKYVIEEGNPQKAMDNFISELSRMWNRHISYRELVVTKSFSKPIEEYEDGRLMHVEAAKKAMARTPGLSFKQGDRFGYIVTVFTEPILEKGRKTAPKCRQATSALEALKTGDPIDINYYADMAFNNVGAILYLSQHPDKSTSPPPISEEIYKRQNKELEQGIERLKRKILSMPQFRNVQASGFAIQNEYNFLEQQFAKSVSSNTSTTAPQPSERLANLRSTRLVGFSSIFNSGGPVKFKKSGGVEVDLGGPSSVIMPTEKFKCAGCTALVEKAKPPLQDGNTKELAYCNDCRSKDIPTKHTKGMIDQLKGLSIESKGVWERCFKCQTRTCKPPMKEVIASITYCPDIACDNIIDRETPGIQIETIKTKYTNAKRFHRFSPCKVPLTDIEDMIKDISLEDVVKKKYV
jgi:DNA polymerase elongation subunit (family B)